MQEAWKKKKKNFKSRVQLRDHTPLRDTSARYSTLMHKLLTENHICQGFGYSSLCIV